MARLLLLQYLLFIFLLLVLSSELVGVSSATDAQFQYTMNGSREQFSLLEPNHTSYSGTKPAYGADGAVWLTPDPETAQELAKDIANANVGRFIFSQPIRFAQASFNTSFEFQIVCVPDASGNCGDGLAFFIASQSAIPANSTGGSLGVMGNGSASPQFFFAVEFDTFQNAPLKDPSSSHIGIDFNSLVSNVTADTSANESLNLRKNNTFLAWVEYSASNHQIQVWMTNINTTSKERPAQPILETHYDLSTIFNEYMYVGFSASTAFSYEGHALYAWNFSTQVDLATTQSPSPARRPTSSDPPGTSKHCKHCTRKLLLPLLLSFSAIALICIVLILIWKHKARPEARQKNQPGISSSVTHYTYSELRRATKGFSNAMLVGKGAFSRVYKGILQVDGSNAAVAIKRLNEGLREEAAFFSEVKIISSIRHRNLLQLHGCCYHKGKALLVYPYMPHGSLDQHLYGGKSEASLSSETRYNILLGVAAALEYLHQGLGECVLHRDVKAANVLLNDDLQPLLGDFGLARLISHNKIVTMTAAGTPGYLSPEVFFTGKVSDRADVYSFGVLALEVACGRSVLDYEQEAQEMNLIQWAWLLQQRNELFHALDPKMELFPTATPTTDEMQGAEVRLVAMSTATNNEIQRAMSTLTTNNEMLDEHYRRWKCALHLGLMCCHPLPEARPTMRQVHHVLKEIIIVPLPTTTPDFPYSSSNGKNQLPRYLSQWPTSSTSSCSVVVAGGGRSLTQTESSGIKQMKMQPVSRDKKLQPA